MSCLTAALLLLAAPLADPDPEQLVTLLGSADRVERDEAARTLLELGATSLPALRAARGRGNPSIRERSAALEVRVEGRLLELPTRVRLDFDGLPLEQVMRTLAERSGFRLTLDAAKDPALPKRPVRAAAPEPVSFWDALDQVGRAAHIRLDPSASESPNSFVPRLHFIDGVPDPFHVNRGPFFVQLLGVHRHRDQAFAKKADREDVSRRALYVEIQVFAEPGRFLDPLGLPRLEATGAGGAPLPAPPSDAEWPRTDRAPPWIVPGSLSFLQWRLPLGSPEPGPRTLEKLRGTLPIRISTRLPDPQVIPLTEAPGKPFQVDAATLRFGPMAQNAERALRLEFTMRADPASSGPILDVWREIFRDRSEFEDADGRRLSWLPAVLSASPDGELRMGLKFPANLRPVTFRIYRLASTVVEIPFEFDNVAVP